MKRRNFLRIPGKLFIFIDQRSPTRLLKKKKNISIFFKKRVGNVPNEFSKKKKKEKKKLKNDNDLVVIHF